MTELRRRPLQTLLRFPKFHRRPVLRCSHQVRLLDYPNVIDVRSRPRGQLVRCGRCHPVLSLGHSQFVPTRIVSQSVYSAFRKRCFTQYWSQVRAAMTPNPAIACFLLADCCRHQQLSARQCAARALYFTILVIRSRLAAYDVRH